MTGNRRTFIKSLAATSGYLVSGCSTKARPQTPERIIIIGAGMAGISAGRRLQDAGHQVTILEARDRIGGRMWTSRVWDNQPVDLGASWIHGPRGNPLTRIADEIDAPRQATDSEEFPLYGPDGNRLPESVWTEIDSYNDQITRAIGRAGSHDEDISVADAAQQYIDQSGFTETDTRRFQFAANNYIEQEFADDISDLSSHRIGEGDTFSGDDVILPNGYDALPQHLARGLDIRLDQQVAQVQYSEQSVTVITHTERLTADRVIVTLPIGVLKSQAVEFSPKLPPTKLAAIEAIGAGVMNKFALQFPSVFWEREADWIGYLSREKGIFSNWLSFQRSAGIPVLLAFNVGSYGEQVESLSDNEMLGVAMETLRRMYGPKIPNPTGVQATRWQSDPFAQCSYSSPTVGMRDHSRDDLAAPVADRVFFAGEATNARYPSTVHGAYLSGQREAERIIELSRQPKWRISIEQDSENGLQLSWPSQLNARVVTAGDLDENVWVPVSASVRQENGCDMISLERDSMTLRQFFRLEPRVQ